MAQNSLMIETFVLYLGMLIVALIPIYVKGVQRYSKILFFVGTGALFGVCVFDLLPDVFEMGGNLGLLVACAVGLAFSAAHLFHLRSHSQDACEHDHHHGNFFVFFVSIVSHCFASGMLLALSQDYSQAIASNVFLALVAHKAYEALSVTSVLMARKFSRFKIVSLIVIYCLSLPFGVGVTLLLHSQISHNIALFVSCVAVGSLLSCLTFDFLIPSLHQLRSRQSSQKLNVMWLLVGLLLTRIFVG